MVLGTKERITAHRLFSTERFIRSTLPVLYISGRRDFQGTNQFLSDDAYGHLCTRTGALWTPQGYSFDGADDKIKNSTANWRSSDESGTLIVWAKETVGGTIFASCDEATNNYQWGVHIDTNVQLFATIGGTVNSVSGHTTVNNGLWHCVVARSNGSVWTLFVDNIAQTLTLQFGVNNGQWLADVANRDNFTIGSRDRLNPLYYTGDIGEFRYYSRALTYLEIQQVFLTTKWRYS